MSEGGGSVIQNRAQNLHGQQPSHTPEVLPHIYGLKQRRQHVTLVLNALLIPRDCYLTILIKM